MKTRIQFENLSDAISHAKTAGGWIATLETGAVYWYSYQHTMTEVLLDFRGNGDVATAGYYADQAAPA